MPATWAYGLKGAIWGSNAADILSFAALLLMLRHKLATPGSVDRLSRSKWRGATDEVSPAMALEISEEI